MSTYTLDQAREVLRKHFGYAVFRPGQEEIISSVLDGKDTLVVMPTGGGKSLCYQIPALLFEGTTIVVSPLIALMKDQVDALVRANVRATFINSALDFRDANERLEKAKFGWYKLLYVSPERFESTVFLEKIRSVRISLFAVDEAHCISEWGHDFRPSYTKLRQAIEHVGNPQIIALTATATPDVRIDIEKNLELREPNKFTRGFDRPNLTFNVLRGVNKRECILNECSKGESGIIYAGTRKSVDELTQMLQMHGVPAQGYHAGLDDTTRKDIQEKFIGGAARVIVATTAFGMGIDKADVRFVIHHDLPGSIEQYYQEAGRAGRDGKQSVCTILHHPNDSSLPEFFIKSSAPSKELIQSVYSFVHHSVGNPVGSVYRELVPLTTQAIAHQLGNTSEAAVQSALNVLEQSGYIRRINATYALSSIQFLLPPDEMRQWLLREAPDMIAPVAMGLLRAIGGEAFFYPANFNLAEIADKAFLSEEVVLSGLKELQRLGIVKFDAGNRGSGIALLGDRVNSKSLKLDMKKIEKRMQHQVEKLRAIERYVNGHGCRRNIILEYFEETDIQGTCGRCDTCLTPFASLSHFMQQDVFENNKALVLRCVAELSGKFGRTTVADVLRGAKTKRISQFKLYEATTYAKGNHLDKELIVQFIDTLIGMGWLAKTETVHPSIYLTPIGKSKLPDGVKPLVLPRPSEVGEIEIQDHILYEALRSSRRRIAAKLNLPSHILCADTVLRHLTNRLPETKEDCLAIEGMGLTTYEKCGEVFLHVIESHRRDQKLAEAMEQSHGAFPGLSPTIKATFELMTQGKSIAEIAKHRALSEGTISQHLSEMIEKGVLVNLDQFISQEHQSLVRKAVQVLKKPDIKRLKEILGDEITYSELRIMLATIGKGK